MAQGTLSADNVIQAKTSSVNANATASVVLDAGTQAGSTVTVEIWCGNVPITNGGLGGTIPAGFETDAYGVNNTGTPNLFVFRKPNVAAGEGVAGSTSWDFTYIVANNWYWRVTEWDTGLERVFPLEASVSNWATDSVTNTSMSTGTTTQNGRGNTVALAWHHWQASTRSVTIDWNSHTNGFTERDELRGNTSTVEWDASWSWVFSSAVGQFECTASNTMSNRNSQDVYFAVLVVYAATTYA